MTFGKDISQQLKSPGTDYQHAHNLLQAQTYLLIIPPCSPSIYKAVSVDRFISKLCVIGHTWPAQYEGTKAPREL